jgi:ATP-binding protein involved in chromosome partitioning
MLRFSALILQNPSFVTDFFCNFAAKSKNSLPIMTLYPKLIMDALATVTYAGTKKNLVDSNMVVDTPAINGQSVKVVLEFPRDTDPFLKSTVKAAEAAIKYHCGKDVEVEIITEFKSKPRPTVEKLLPDVKNIIAVSSGKGGVGKSTVAANLAIALGRLGYKVGLLDCDIFGPSQPKMFQVEDARPYAVNVDGRDLIEPIEKYGVKLLSIGFFVSPDTATLWRGGMATNALKQLIADADWGALDYFILDTPPGTSDIHLTLLQTLSITGAIIVSTPQQVALADARKGIDMYRNEKVNVPILGLVENMAWFTPAELPENRYYIFGKEGCKQLAEEMGVPLLAQIPLVQGICESGDAGQPAALNSDSMTGLSFINLAQSVVTVVNRRNKELPKTKIVGVK